MHGTWTVAFVSNYACKKKKKKGKRKKENVKEENVDAESAESKQTLNIRLLAE